MNDAIDNAFSGTTFFDTLMENETYHSQYYAYLQQLVSEYIDGDGFDAFYTRVRSQIDTLVESDPTAFYSYDEYLTAAETLYQVVKLRGQSIQGQLDGTIPSTEAAQRTSDALVDASALDIGMVSSMDEIQIDAVGDDIPPREFDEMESAFGSDDDEEEDEDDEDEDEPVSSRKRSRRNADAGI